MLRKWVPSDYNEPPRLVEVLYLVMSPEGYAKGAVVIEAEKELPGVAFVPMCDLRKIVER